jgi:hypothetical protein
MSEKRPIKTSLNLSGISKAKKDSLKRSRKHKGDRIKTKFGRIDRVWAENGVVNVVDEKGTKIHLTPIQAFERCRSIQAMARKMKEAADKAENDNAMSKHAMNMRREAAITFDKVQKFIKAAQEAHRQLETHDEKALGLYKLKNGRDYVTGEATHVKGSIDSRVAFYHKKYHTLTEEEIHKILTIQPGKYTDEQRDKILMGEHTNRMIELANSSDMDNLPTFKN